MMEDRRIGFGHAHLARDAWWLKWPCRPTRCRSALPLVRLTRENARPTAAARAAYRHTSHLIARDEIGLEGALDVLVVIAVGRQRRAQAELALRSEVVGEGGDARPRCGRARHAWPAPDGPCHVGTMRAARRQALLGAHDGQFDRPRVSSGQADGKNVHRRPHSPPSVFAGLRGQVGLLRRLAALACFGLALLGDLGGRRVGATRTGAAAVAAGAATGVSLTRDSIRTERVPSRSRRSGTVRQGRSWCLMKMFLAAGVSGRTMNSLTCAARGSSSHNYEVHRRVQGIAAVADVGQAGRHALDAQHLDLLVVCRARKRRGTRPAGSG